MQGEDLVRKDIRSLILLCNRHIKEFSSFQALYPSSEEVIGEVNDRIREVRDKWQAILKYIKENGMEEEGEYSYPRLAINVSLAYKELSEIINRLRFGLESLELRDKFLGFEKG